MKIEITTRPIDTGALLAHLATPSAGGIDVFIGTTRRWTDGRETVRLEYDAYTPMALKELRRLGEEARTRWPVERLVIVHRLGPVAPAEASVVVGVATPHRDDAFAACRWLIDTLKQQVPIWKREVLRDGSKEWVEGDAPPSVPGEG